MRSPCHQSISAKNALEPSKLHFHVSFDHHTMILNYRVKKQPLLLSYRIFEEKSFLTNGYNGIGLQLVISRFLKIKSLVSQTQQQL